MQAPVARVLLALIPAAACGGDSPITPPEHPVLTTVTVSPDTATLFTVPPGTSIRLQVEARDQNGAAMTGLDPAQFASAATSVATVGGDGTVTAVSPGDAVITATVADGEVSRSGSAEVTVLVPPPGASVQAPAFRFEPSRVDVAAGGAVSWTMGEHFHDVVFSAQNAPENIQPTRLATVTREFPVAGDFGYRCLIHTGMTGTVRVH